MEEYKHKELTHKIIGCAMKVHSALGNGFPEIIYQRALAIELELAGITFDIEVELPLYYHDRQIGVRRADLLIEGEGLVELKAISEINAVHHS